VLESEGRWMASSDVVFSFTLGGKEEEMVIGRQLVAPIGDPGLDFR